MSENLEKTHDLERYHSGLFSLDGIAALYYINLIRNINLDTINEYKVGWCNTNDVNYCLRGRLTVPLIDLYGDIVAFAGRVPTFKNDDKIYSLYNGEVIKHIENDKVIKNIPVWWHEGCLPKKNFLYGLYNNYKEIYESNCAIVVEGEFDLWACWQHGIKNVVALLGSAFTVYQLSLLTRFCDNIILMLDGDAAGQVCTEKTLKSYSKYDSIHIESISLPVDYDPFTFIDQYGAEPLLDSINTISCNFK